MKKTIILGISGGIAAFKAAQLTSNLIKKGYDVEVIMTQNATEFITPLTFESLTKHNVMVSTFEKVADRSVKHISIAKRADLFVIVPATANVIAKVAHGLADDMLTTTFLAANCPKLICPAMNTDMYENLITQDNLRICASYGMQILDPANGFLACGDVGKGKLAELQDIEDKIEEMLQSDKFLKGMHVLVTAGPTQEALDPVRFISNHSSGKMGYELAKAARDVGAHVTLVSGHVALSTPQGIDTISITSAQEMYEVVMKHASCQDFIIKAAAVGDYRPLQVAQDKIKKAKDELQVSFVKNPDILKTLGFQKPPGQILCGFAMETKDLEANARNKMLQKQCDMIVANNLKIEGAGFQTDTNVATFFYEDQIKSLQIMSKRDLSFEILHTLWMLKQKVGGK